MKKILLVDDEPDIVEFLKYNLEQQNFEVLVGYNGIEALKKVKQNPDLIILDIMMDGMNGFEVCEKIKANPKYENIPIIFLTAKAGEVDEIKGLKIGASDYIQKPISPKKLIARVISNLRKTGKVQKQTAAPRVTKAGPILIDLDKFIIKVKGKTKILPRKEFQLLNFLAENPGRVFTRDDLLKSVWGEDVYVVPRTVDVHIRKIREKLGESAGLIETVKGVGYKFKSFEES
jgi:two-component system alkaline phosphatase synthesis response regulator PhoP